MRVAIHRNLTTGKWVVSSVKTTRNGERKDKRLRDTDVISLKNVSFVTCSAKSIARIQRNILDKTVSSGREVVAYAIGDLYDYDVSAMTPTQVSWNPLKGREFYTVPMIGSARSVTDDKFAYASFSTHMYVGSPS